MGVLVPAPGLLGAGALVAVGRGAGSARGEALAAGGCGIAIAGALEREGGAEFGNEAGAATGPDARGAAMGRAAGPAAGAVPGIMGRGGNSIGRPAAGVWRGDASGGFAGGCRSGIGAAGAARCGSGITGGIALGAGVGPFGTRAGSDVSRSAAASAALARWAAPTSSSSGDRGAAATGAVFDENSSSIDEPAEIVMTPPHTEQRARTVVEGTFAGSTRKIERHSGQETFTSPPSRPSCRVVRRPAAPPQALRPVVGRSRRPNREASSRSSSFLLQVHSLAPRV